MDIQNNSIVTDADTDVLDSQITQISNDFAETYYFDNEQQEELEMLVAKCMKLGELYERKKWQAAQTSVAPEGFEQAYSEIFSPIVKQPYPRLENGDYKYIEIDQGWKLWQAATVHAVPEWISVKDKLPGFNQSVLSCDGFETCVAEYLESCKNEYGVFFEEGFWINGAASIFENVTHWMPLPEAIEALEPTDD